MKNKIVILLVLLPLMAEAEVKKPINFKNYIEQVREQNIAYAAQKLNIPIADAKISAAKIFNDPTLSIEYAYNDDHRMQMGQGVSGELSKTFSPGKRTARIDLALSEKEMTAAVLDNYFHTLRSEATIAYLEAIKQGELYQVKLNSYLSISELAKSDSVKWTLGKITETDALQSRIEAGVIYNELLKAQSELYNSYVALNVPLSSFNADTLYVPIGALQMAVRKFEINELLTQSLANRADLAAAFKNVTVAQKALKLARRERNIDFDIALGYNYNTEVRNELAPAPRFSGMTLGVSVPLKFSNFNRGTIRAASLTATQAEYDYRQAQIEVQTEVMKNHNLYLSLSTQVEHYTNGMLDKAKAVIDGKIYSYSRGESSLLEVLNAERTYNDLRAMYIQTLFDHAAGLVMLEGSVGIWDITIE
ncbi:MAG: TolC family protein [Mucinivorans sp.]